MKNPKLDEFNQETKDLIKEMRTLGYSEEEIDSFQTDRMENKSVLFDPYCGGQ